jgi:hypothetical protein
MPKPVSVSIDVPEAREVVFDHLDVMANHEPFMDHLLKDWRVSGPARGVGAKARVRVRAFGVSDDVDIEVIDAAAPERIVERNVRDVRPRAARVGRDPDHVRVPLGCHAAARPAHRTVCAQVHPPRERGGHAPPRGAARCASAPGRSGRRVTATTGSA